MAQARLPSSTVPAQRMALRSSAAVSMEAISAGASATRSSETGMRAAA
jgi:hypothetical protein